jgi:hypothetical protein
MLFFVFVIFSDSFYGQSPTGNLRGTTVDPSGLALVGVEVKAEDIATGAAFEATSSADGQFAIANLSPGLYTVTVTRTGFRKVVFRDVKIIVGQTYDLSVKLELGEVAETVVVEAGQEVLETTTATVGTTITGQAITQLPFTSRDVLDLAVLMPGAQTTGRPRQTSFNGLPKGSINITYDGINVQDSVLKSNDGFFTLIRPRVDDVEEFGISTAAQGAEQAAEGAVQIRFSSKRGGSVYHGGVWWYHRNDFLNANYYFNNLTNPPTPRQRFRLNEYGYKIGGPILKDKLFFFTDFDFYSNPQSQSRTKTILTTAASQGLFTYPVAAVPSSRPAWVTCNTSDPANAGKPTCTANLLQMAGNFGFTSSVDTVVGGLLTAMNSAVSAPAVQLAAAPSLFQRAITFNNPGTGTRKFPDLRLDWNINKNNSFEFNYHYSHFTATPDFLNGYDQTYPVAPFNTNQGSQISNRNLFVGAWRSSMGSNKSNELRFGLQSSPVSFFPDLNLSVYPEIATNLGPSHIRPVLNLVDQPLLAYSTQGRNGALGQLIETFTWARGKHTFNFGTTWTEQRYNDFNADESVSDVSLGVDQTDRVAAQFNRTNLPGISSDDLGNAQDLYGMLAGRITGYTGNVYFDAASRQFKTGANLVSRVHQREFGFYGTDSWRFRPSLTFSYGLRWEYQGAPVDVLNEFFRLRGGLDAAYGVSGPGNLFKPGTLTGTTPVFELNNGRPWWNKDLKDFAPSIGLAWQPGLQNSVWKKLFGEKGKTVFRAGYSISYTREGLNNFFTIAQGNPGFSGAQKTTPGQAGQAGQFEAGKLQVQNKNIPTLAQTPSSFQTTVNIDPVAGDSVNAFDPNLKVPRVQSWSVGVQRQISDSMVLEVRYVGNHGTGLLRQDNLNEVNIFENGFLKEFLNAQNNLAICRGTPSCTSPSFANLGLPGQIPVPILTAAFTRSKTGSQTDAGFRNGTRIGFLDNGLAGSFANALSGSLGLWKNLMAAGYDSNFWRVNPDARGGAFRFANGTQSTYNALQVEFRRRPSAGLQFSGNYTYSRSLTNYFANSSISFTPFDTLRDPGRNKGLAPFDLRHAFKLQAIYELPFGPKRRWNSRYGFVNRMIEGWEFNSIMRWQSGRVTQLQGGRGGTFNQYDGGVSLNGLTPDQLQGMLDIRKTPDGKVFWFPASLIGSDGRANTAFLQPCNTPGAFCRRSFITGPRFFRADLSAVKRTYITERTNFEFRAEFLNAFNNINFLYGGSAAATPTFSSLRATTFGRMTNAYQDISTTDDPGGRIIQLVLRFNF